MKWGPEVAIPIGVAIVIPDRVEVRNTTLILEGNHDDQFDYRIV
jgi:hypothetical protein